MLTVGSIIFGGVGEEPTASALRGQRIMSGLTKQQIAKSSKKAQKNMENTIKLMSGDSLRKRIVFWNAKEFTPLKGGRKWIERNFLREK